MRVGGGSGRRHPATTGDHDVAILQQNLPDAVLTMTLLVMVALAVRQDLSERRISNGLTLAGLVCGIALQSLSGGTSGFLNALAGAGVGLLCFLPLYLSKGMGAGDVKLMAAAGAFFGPADAFIAALLSLASGAVLALVILTWRVLQVRTAAAGTSGGGVGPTLLQLRKERFPYAAAIAIGVVAKAFIP
jgi:prepilin peptidase CpaA